MKTSKLSLAAIAALGISTVSLSASNLIDIRLPHNSWKFIGVNGGFTELSSSVFDINTSKYDKSASEGIDDNASTTVYNDGSGDLVTFKVIDNSSASEFSSAVMYVSSSGHSYDGTYSQPEMYVYVDTGDGNTTPDIRIKYQADYEGETFYLELNGSDYVYRGTFDSAATYESPQALVNLSGNGSYAEENLSIDYVFDRNITNNPGAAGVKGSKNSYTYSSNHDDIGSSDTLRIYYYDAVNSTWKTYIKKNGSVISQDFTALEKGKGYWVKYEASNSHNDAGLILGDTGIQPSDYSASELTTGWNMLSFNDSSLIATGGTGMIVEFNSSVSPDFTLLDSEGTESIDVNVTYETNVSAISRITQQINKQIAQAKVYGTLSKNFNVIAIPVGDNAGGNASADTNKIVLLSDKKFRLKDGGSGTIKSATTLSGQALYVPSLGKKAANNADINTTAVESVYGEHVLGLRIPTDSGTFTANSILADKGRLLLTINDTQAEINVSGKTNLSQLATDINESNETIYSLLQLDTDFNDQNDTILVVNPTYNFSVQDGVFVKTFQVNESPSDSATVKLKDINGSTYATISIAETNNTAQEVAEEFNHDVSGSDFEANRTNGYIYVATNLTTDKNFYLEQTSGDTRLIPVVDSSENNATGTVREVYSIENLAKATVDYYTTTWLEVNSSTDSGAGKVYVEFNITNPKGEKLIIRYGNEINATAGDYNITSVAGVSLDGPTVLDWNGSSSDTNRELNISVDGDDLNASTGSTQTTINAKIFVAALDYFLKNQTDKFNVTVGRADYQVVVYGDYNGTHGDYNSSSKDVNITTVDYTDSNITSIPSITSDLGYSKVYAGSVTTDPFNPVPYIQKVTGYKMRKILTTNEDADGNSISWSFIDLTKDSSNWFDAVDGYNLFSFDKTKGYWVYLENSPNTTFDNFPAGTDSTALSVTTIYNHVFVNDTGRKSNSNNYTTTNYISSMGVQVALSDGVGTIYADSNLIDRAVVTLGDGMNSETFNMTKSGNQYVASIDEIQNLGSSPTLELNATLFTADNFSVTASKVIDNTPPTRPIVNVTNGDLTSATITSSADTVIFRAYSGDVDMAGTNLIDGNISASNGQATINVCSMAQSFNTNVGSYRFIAVDNENMNYGLVSNIGYLDTADYNATIYPIYKDGSILTVQNDQNDSISDDYNSSCESITNTTDHGVALKGENGYTVSVAYGRKDTTFAQTSANNLKTVDLKVDGTKVGQIQFDSATYGSSDIFLMYYDGRIYSTDFGVLTGQDGDAAYFTENNVTMLTGQTIQ